MWFDQTKAVLVITKTMLTTFKAASFVLTDTFATKLLEIWQVQINFEANRIQQLVNNIVFSLILKIKEFT